MYSTELPWLCMRGTNTFVRRCIITANKNPTSRAMNAVNVSHRSHFHRFSSAGAHACRIRYSSPITTPTKISTCRKDLIHMALFLFFARCFGFAFFLVLFAFFCFFVCTFWFKIHKLQSVAKKKVTPGWGKKKESPGRAKPNIKPRENKICVYCFFCFC
jgi:hypothetical protein